MRILIVGNLGGTNVGSSFLMAAISLGLEAEQLDSKRAQFGIKIIDAIFWRLFKKRQALQYFFNRIVLKKINANKIDLLLTTGHNPLNYSVLTIIKTYGCHLVHFSTDDPWNHNQKANWFLSSLLAYDIIYTPRKSNILDFKNLGCKIVEYLKFGYDEFIFMPKKDVYLVKDLDVLFVGGADTDRALFFRDLKNFGVNFKLIGSYWERFPELASCSLGKRTPEETIFYTLSTKVNLCLVRRANRDGHVMRTFEMAAIGACMLVEDTAEHREIFGKEGVVVYYFDSAKSASEKTNWLLSKPQLINELSIRAKQFVTNKESYTDRLRQILNSF